MITIKYNSNPNVPKEWDHTGNRIQMVEEKSRKFKSLDRAIEFWLECTSPITRLEDISPEEWTKRFNDIKINEGIFEAEAYLRSEMELV